MVGISPSVTQSGGGTRVGKHPKKWEEFPGKWEGARADVDDPYVATMQFGYPAVCGLSGST